MTEWFTDAQNRDTASQSAQPKESRQADSNESKRKRGGKRPGAGRKPNYAKRLLSGVKPLTAAEALEGIDVKAVVHDLLKHGSRPVKLQTLTVLWDRIYGRRQSRMLPYRAVWLTSTPAIRYSSHCRRKP